MVVVHIRDGWGAGGGGGGVQQVESPSRPLRKMFVSLLFQSTA